MNAKNVLNKDFNCNFNERVFIFDCAKSVMSFLRKFIYYNTNRIITIKIEKICNKVYNYVLLSFNEHRKKYKKIILTIVESF